MTGGIAMDIAMIQSLGCQWVNHEILDKVTPRNASPSGNKALRRPCEGSLRCHSPFVKPCFCVGGHA